MTARNVLILLLLFLLSACSAHSVSRTGKPAVYSMDGIPFRPGAVSWSPDSSRLALIKDDQLVLFDSITGISRRIPEIRPLFLEWAPAGRVVVLREKGAGREILMLDPAQGTYQSVPADENTEAVRWLNPPDELITFATDIKKMKIGTFVAYKLILVKGAERDVFYQRELYFPTRRDDLEFTSAWLFPGISPLDETVLIPEYHNPPAVPPYTHFKTVDPLTGLVTDIRRIDSRRFNVLASWSPDGSRLSVSNDEGQLLIIDSENQDVISPLNYDIRGLQPSWNPRGSQIYLGGWLIRSDGEVIEKLLDNADKSLALWSPDGKKLAVMTGETMLVFDSFHPFFIDPDKAPDHEFIEVRDKLRLLKNLLRDGLILNSEFHARRAKLLEKVRGDGK